MSMMIEQMHERRGEEASLNFQTFLVDLPSLMARYKGQHAVYHDRRMAGVFITFQEAVSHGLREYGTGAFSVQEITDEIAHV